MLCSIGYNQIGDKGASALAAILKETMISNLKCAAAPERSLLCQRPLTQKRTPLHSLPCQKANTFLSEHTRSLLWPAETFPHSLANAHTHTHTLPHFSTSTQCRPPSSAAWTAATSSCRTGGSRVLPRPSQPPCDPPRHRLRHNGLSEKAMQALRDAAGSGVSITL